MMIKRCCGHWYFGSKRWVDHRFKAHGKEIAEWAQKQQAWLRAIEYYGRHA